MVMPWRTRAPAMTLQPPVHIGYGHRASYARAHSLAPRLGRHRITTCCPGMPLLQERRFLGPPEQRPTPPAAACALTPASPQRVYALIHVQTLDYATGKSAATVCAWKPA